MRYINQSICYFPYDTGLKLNLDKKIYMLVGKERLYDEIVFCNIIITNTVYSLIYETYVSYLYSNCTLLGHHASLFILNLLNLQC